MQNTYVVASTSVYHVSPEAIRHAANLGGDSSAVQYTRNQATKQQMAFFSYAMSSNKTGIISVLFCVLCSE